MMKRAQLNWCFSNLHMKRHCLPVTDKSTLIGLVFRQCCLEQFPKHRVYWGMLREINFAFLLTVERAG